MVEIINNLVNGGFDLEQAKDFVYNQYEGEITSAGLAASYNEVEHEQEHLSEAEKWSAEMTLLSRLGYTEDGKLQFKTKEQYLPEIEEALRLESNDNEIYKYKKLIEAVSKEEYTNEEYSKFTVFTDTYELR